MIKRTLFFVKPFHLSVRNGQLIAKDKETKEERTVPIEDVGYVVFDNQQISFTQSVPVQLIAHNIATVFCNEKHHPTSMLLNLDGNHLQTEVFSTQINASEALKKQLWQQTIKAKIKNQSAVLQKLDRNFNAMPRYADKVLSGDTTNREAQAARYYWQNLFTHGELIKFIGMAYAEEKYFMPYAFGRDRAGMSPNDALNYGYAILRAATAKALVGSGMLPTLGIHHHNRYNAYCLADDIMEPYRPYVDYHIHENVVRKFTYWKELTTEIKMEILKLLTLDCQMGELKRPLMIALTFTTASLARCYSGESRKIAYPIL